MKKIYLILILNLFTGFVGFSQVNLLVHRSEFERVGDLIYNLEDSNEGSISYSIISGNSDGYFGIDAISGEITIVKEIPDEFNTIHTASLKIEAGDATYALQIVDGYDYLINNLPEDYTVLRNHNDLFIDSASEWSVYNNLWGKGTAVPNEDFRIATIHRESLPDTTILVWDTPGRARDYDGAAVWCYNNVFWGNRLKKREDLHNFPFQIDTLQSLYLNFDFRQLFGDDQFKIAMNMFLTDEDYLTDFSSNDGDFFFVFDQKDTWIPSYPYVLPDTTILGKPFALLYDNEKDSEFYERRRVIIKDNERLMSGRLDVRNIFDRFIREGFLNSKQYIYHIQLGIEVTSGFGAVSFNNYDFTGQEDSPPLISAINEAANVKVNIYPNPFKDILNIEGEEDEVKIYDLRGRHLKIKITEGKADFSGYSTGTYIIKTATETYKVIKL